MFISKILYVLFGLRMLWAFKVRKTHGETFEEFVVAKCRKDPTYLYFALRFFRAEENIGCLVECSGIEGWMSKATEAQFSAVIQALVWQKRFADANYWLDDVSGRRFDLSENEMLWHKALIGYLEKGEISEAFIEKFNRGVYPRRDGFFVGSLFRVYVLCHIGLGALAENDLIEFVRTRPRRFMEFQEKFEHTGYKQFHIGQAEGQ